jgi:hypothetical protein
MIGVRKNDGSETQVRLAKTVQWCDLEDPRPAPVAELKTGIDVYRC